MSSDPKATKGQTSKNKEKDGEPVQIDVACGDRPAEPCLGPA